MHNKISPRGLIALSLLISAPAGAQAQTAAQYNRAAQAMQICASPAGAMLPECAQLRGAVGGAPAPGAANAIGGLFGGGKATAAAGLLGMATQAAAAAKAKAAAPPAAAPVQFGAPSPVGASAAAYDRNTNTALAVQGAAAQYQACVAQVGPANAPGVQGCLAQLQAAGGGPAPTASTASAVGSAAVNVLGSLLRR
jgi:hypothetical protein